MEFLPYTDGSGYEARFSRCGICTRMTELGIREIRPVICRLDYTMSDADEMSDFITAFSAA